MIREVVCLVFCKDGKLLLEQRLDEITKNRWTFTGGKIELQDFVAGKDYKTLAAAREAAEETNLRPLSCRHLETFEEVSITGRSFIFHTMVIAKWQGRLKNREPHRRKLLWVPLEDALVYIGDNKVDRRVLEAFLKLR